MMKVVLFIFLIFSSCSSHKAAEYKDRTPVLNYKKLLTGNLKAYGVIFDFFGKQSDTFTIESVGTLNKEKNRIDMKQKFIYSDGKIEEGEAYALFDDNEPNHFVYKDHMMVEEAKYDQYGNSANIKYKLNVKRDNGSTITVNCNDWLYLVSDNIGINTIEMSKVGLNVSKIIMTLIKE